LLLQFEKGDKGANGAGLSIVFIFLLILIELSHQLELQLCSKTPEGVSYCPKAFRIYASKIIKLKTNPKTNN
jgi:hypothetical protein